MYAMREWINNRLDDIGETKASLSRHLGLPFARVSEVISGKRDVRSGEIKPLAAFLKLSPALVLDLLDDPETEIVQDDSAQPETQSTEGLHIDPDLLYDAILKLNQELVKQKKKMPASMKCITLAIYYDQKRRKLNGLPQLSPAEIAMLFQGPEEGEPASKEDSDALFM